MSLSNQVSAYPDCEEFWAEALRDSRGARALYDDFDKASRQQMRMNHYRVLLRKESQRVYPKDDPAWNKCEYDILVVRVKPAIEPDAGKFWVYVERHGLDMRAFERLSEVEGEEDRIPIVEYTHHNHLQIEDHTDDT